jgi:GT2 family glycosyltransferase
MATVSASASPRVSVIILNWNGREHLVACLPSLLAQSYTDFEIIVVDNGSTDGTVDWLRDHFPQVRLIQNATNRGFAAANNQAICASTAEYLALLNNDTVVDERWLEVMVRTADGNPQIGMVAAHLWLAGRPAVIDSAGIAIDRASLAWGITADHLEQAAHLPVTHEVFGASGGAALYRRAMLAEIGLFDEDFFAYLEDVDLAWRAQWAGWRAVYAPDAVVWHHHSATSNRIPHLKSRLLGRNKLWLIAKNYPFPHILWYLPVIMIYELMALAYAWREGRLRSALAGRLAAIAQLPKMIAKRRTQIRRITPQAMFAKLAPIEPPWRLMRRYAHLPPTPVNTTQAPDHPIT